MPANKKWNVGAAACTVALLFVPATVLAAEICAGRPDVQSRVVNGRDAAIVNWPGQAVFRSYDPQTRNYDYFCGGTAISRDVILTAAHCLYGWEKRADGVFDMNGRKVDIALATDDLSKKLQHVRDIAKFEVHEKFAFVGGDWRNVPAGNDIAVVWLATPWDGAVAQLSLSAKSDPVKTGTWVKVAGFGYTEPGKMVAAAGPDGIIARAGSLRLQEVEVPTVGTAKCREVWSSSVIGEGQICAGYDDDTQKDSCNGDSGGPLIATDRRGCPYQIGLVSWGPSQCGKRKAYGVYTRVSAHRDWIAGRVPMLVSARTAEPIPDEMDSSALSAVRDIEQLLAKAAGRVTVQMDRGTKLKLGEYVEFNIKSQVKGTPILIDVDGGGAVVQLFPNKWHPTYTLDANAPLVVPTATMGFKIKADNAGPSKLLLIVAPPEFDMTRLVASAERTSRGLAVEEAPVNYLANLLKQISTATAGARGLTVTAAEPLPGWGYTALDYEIVR